MSKWITASELSGRLEAKRITSMNEPIRADDMQAAILRRALRLLRVMTGTYKCCQHACATRYAFHLSGKAPDNRTLRCSL